MTVYGQTIGELEDFRAEAVSYAWRIANANPELFSRGGRWTAKFRLPDLEVIEIDGVT